MVYEYNTQNPKRSRKRIDYSVQVTTKTSPFRHANRANQTALNEQSPLNIRYTNRME
jgi:hypothetical protein